VQTTLLALESLQIDRFQREAKAARRRSLSSARRTPGAGVYDTLRRSSRQTALRLRLAR
jgi:hypothetical protein